MFHTWTASSTLTRFVYLAIRKYILAHFSKQPAMLLGWISEKKFNLLGLLSSSRQSSTLRKATLHQQLSTAPEHFGKMTRINLQTKRSELRVSSLLGEKLAMEECLPSSLTRREYFFGILQCDGSLMNYLQKGRTHFLSQGLQQCQVKTYQSAKKYQWCGIIPLEMTQSPL